MVVEGKIARGHAEHVLFHKLPPPFEFGQRAQLREGL